jgi:peptidyl-prolyl cis-trans isomerase B (cyclophilin B)
VVRIEAVRGLGKLKGASVVAALRPMLNDSSWRVAEQAAESLRVVNGQPMSAHLTALPHVHFPPLQRDALASLPALPRTPADGKAAAPNASQAILDPAIDPITASDMTGPAHGAHPRVRIVTTKGNIYVTLFPEWAPLTTANFLNLANRGYYDGNRWFRIVPDFVVQTGDPNDNGEGDAGYSVPAEENPLEQGSYVISMGLNYDDKTQTPLRDSAGTQYYVTLSPQYHLDGDFTVFGWVTSGSDVLSRLIESDRVVRVERIADETL